METLKTRGSIGPKDQRFAHADSDALLIPNRLAPLLASVNASRSDSHVGRPASSCDCNNAASARALEHAWNICAGAFCTTSKATLNRINLE